MSDRPNRRRTKRETTPGSSAAARPAEPTTSTKKKRDRGASVDATCVVPNAVLSGLRDAIAEDDDPPSSRSKPSVSGVARKQQAVAAIRDLYAKGEIDAAMALATELSAADSDRSPPTPRMIADGSNVDASVWVGPDVDVSLGGAGSLSGLEPAAFADVSFVSLGGADAPDASIRVEVLGEVDVSLTGLEPYAHAQPPPPPPRAHAHPFVHPQPHHRPAPPRDGADAPDSSIQVIVGPELELDIDVSLSGLEPRLDEPPAERSLPGLTNIIDDIESVEPTIQRYRRKPSQEILLAQQRLLARELSPVIAPLVSMPPSSSGSGSSVKAASSEEISRTLQTSKPPLSAVAKAMPPPAVVMNLSLTERQSIPRLIASPADISKLPLGPRGGFILSQIDGMQTLEEILDICAMPPSEAVEIIRHLQSLGVIELD